MLQIKHEGMAWDSASSVVIMLLKGGAVGWYTVCWVVVMVVWKTNIHVHSAAPRVHVVWFGWQKTSKLKT